MSKDTTKDRSHKIPGPYAEFNLKLMLDDKLTWAEKAYYVALLDRAGYEDRGWSFQTHEKMSRYGFTSRYSKDLSRSLHEKGYIKKLQSKHGFVSHPTEFYGSDIRRSLVEEEEAIYMRIHK